MGDLTQSQTALLVERIGEDALRNSDVSLPYCLMLDYDNAKDDITALREQIAALSESHARLLDALQNIIAAAKCTGTGDKPHNLGICVEE